MLRKFKINLFLSKWNIKNCTTFSKVAKLPKADEVSICVVGNGAEGNPRSLFLNYNDEILMFNCGEGLQRVVPNFGFKSSKIKSLFLTSNDWRNFSGLSSVLLARYDAGIKDFDINGFDNQNIIKECIHFDTKLKRIRFNFLNFKSNSNFVFNKLTINPIILEVNNFKTIVYLAKLSAQKGNIDLDKCFKLRIPRHLVSVLENNETILLEDGRTILRSEVTYPDQPEKCFMIFECLNSNFLSSLYSHPTINDFLKRCDCIFHFTKDSFLKQQEYKVFFKKHKSVHHLLLTESNPSLCLHSAHRFQKQLNFIDSQLFPLLHENKEDFNYEKVISDKIIYCPAGLTYHLRPDVSNQTQSPICVDKAIMNIKDNFLLHKDGSVRVGLDEEITKLRLKQEAFPCNGPKYPEFVFLGTASSMSLPIRNVSSILVNISDDSSILLDCGENTYGQLLRFYGSENIKKILNKVKVVFISHHHSDHHVGLIQMILQHNRHINDRKLMIILPSMVNRFLNSKSIYFSNLNDSTLKYQFVINQNFDKYKSKLTNLLKIKNFDLFPVQHCAYAYGLSIVTQSGFKFVYSGDTQPCESIVFHGDGCDLLIHEATVEDNLIDFARFNFHSTMTQAIDIGKAMNAKFTLLTHFSQRYGKLPFVPENESMPVGLAFDNMKVSPCQLNRIPLMYDALKCMYSKHLNNLEYRRDLYGRKYRK